MTTTTTTTTLYHGGVSQISEIVEYGDRIPDLGGYDLFGGVFASARVEIALSHGDEITEFNIPDSAILTQSVLRQYAYAVDSEAVGDFLRAALRCPVDQVEFDVAWDIVVEEGSVYGSALPDERILEIFGSEDLAHAAWEAQSLRGRIGESLGYSAVEMEDEHGVSYLILAGTEPVNDCVVA